MKAVVMRDQSLNVEQVSDPVPGPGEVLVRTLACGICGSDLHMFKHCGHALSSFKRGNIPISFDPARGVVFGHEYCAEILDYGPGTERKLKAGTRVCSVPLVFKSDTIEPLIAVSKEMNVHFAYGCSGEEFGQTLLDLADGKLDAAPIITSVVQPEGVAQAFETLAQPEDEAKIMINFD
jgi:threonine dehydrogenase-like Zn-dependent dehydrogenase